DFSRQIPIHHLHCSSNARLFFYRSLAEKIGRTGLREMEIPFFGQKSLHDRVTRIKGSFLQTVQGIHNLRKYASCLKLRALIYITQENHGTLPELTRFLSRLGIDEFQFIFSPGPCGLTGHGWSELPGLHDLLPSIRKTAAFLTREKKRYSLTGFPLCIPRDLRKNIIDPNHPFDETITYGKKIVNDRQERLKQKRKPSSCRTCRAQDLCEGIWIKYIKNHGIPEFKPN
ncbi:MAG: hypothetical protein PHF84_12525, partial [bacterium]|nr:hypothetical protein [bacterium]